MFASLPFAASASLRRTIGAGFALLLTTAAAQAQTPTIVSYTPNGGAAGTTITVVGTNLGTTTSVLLNGQFMPIVSKSATLLTARIPATASSGRFRITTPTGTVLSSTPIYATRSSSSGSTTQITSSFNGIDVGNYSTPTVADLDNDGLVDLLVGTEAGTIVRYEQSTANSTTFGTTATTLTAGGTAIDIGTYAKPTVTDLDGDGLLDLLVGEGTGTIIRYEQTAANALTFNNLGVLTAGGSTINVGAYARPTVADIDGDGLLDMLVGATAGNVAWYEQSSANSGTFISRGLLTTNGSTVIDAGDVSKPLIIDMDGDGLLDLLVGNDGGVIYQFEQSIAAPHHAARRADELHRPGQRRRRAAALGHGPGAQQRRLLRGALRQRQNLHDGGRSSRRRHQHQRPPLPAARRRGRRRYPLLPPAPGGYGRQHRVLGRGSRNGAERRPGRHQRLPEPLRRGAVRGAAGRHRAPGRPRRAQHPHRPAGVQRPAAAAGRPAAPEPARPGPRRVCAAPDHRRRHHQHPARFAPLAPPAGPCDLAPGLPAVKRSWHLARCS
jgi:uncharacterized protein (DUF2141 family)